MKRNRRNIGLGNPAAIATVAASNPKSVEKVVDTASFITKIAVGVAVAGGIFAAYKIYQFFNPKSEAEAAQYLADQQGNLNNVTNDLELQSAAYQLADYLGTKGSIWNPSNWTEDDEAAADVVIAMRNDYAKLAQLYSIITSRNLTQDLIDLLDSDQLLRVRQYVNI